MDAPATVGEALALDLDGEPLGRFVLLTLGEELGVERVLAELARPRDPRRPVGRGLFVSGPRGSGKSTLLAYLARRIEEGAVGELAGLDPVVVRAERAEGPSILAAVARALGAEVPAAPERGPSPRDLADAVGALCRRCRPSSGLLVLVLDDLDATDPEAQRPLLAHLLLRGQGRIAVLAAGSHPPRDEGGTLDACFPESQRVQLGEGTVAALAAELLLRKTAEARRALPAEAAALYPFSADVLRALVRLTGALVSQGAPGPLPLARDLLAEARPRRLGALIPLDAAYPFLGGLLPPAMAAAVDGASHLPPAAERAARALALLSVLGVDDPVSPEHLSVLLRDAWDAESRSGIDELLAAGVARAWPGRGLVLVTGALAAWEADRAAIDVTGEEVSQMVRDDLAILLDGVAPPAGFAYRAVYADGRRAHDEPILDRGGGETVTLDVRHLPLYRRTREEWLGRSVRGNLAGRLIWIAGGDLDGIRALGAELARSRRQIRRATPVLTRPAPELAALLDLEAARRDAVAASLRDAVRHTFLAGTFYCRGEAMPASGFGEGFAEVLRGATAAALPRLREASGPAPAPPPEAPPEALVALPHGRVIHTVAEAETLLAELGARIRAALESGASRVRLD